MNKKISIANEKAMMELGGKIADQFPHGGIVLLNGDLGAGKTTLVRGLLRHLGYKGTVKSPTYTLVEPYSIECQPPHNKNKKHKKGGCVLNEPFDGYTLYHFDLYRLGDPEELEYIGGRDYWEGNSLCLIEWPEKAKGYLPEADLEITIHHDDESRIVEIMKGIISI